jgi:hypothetical protein
MIKASEKPFGKTFMLLAAYHAGNHSLTWASKESAVTGLHRILSILSKDRKNFGWSEILYARDNDKHINVYPPSRLASASCSIIPCKL